MTDPQTYTLVATLLGCQVTIAVLTWRGVRRIKHSMARANTAAALYRYVRGTFEEHEQ